MSEEPIRFAYRDREGKLLPPFPIDPIELTRLTRRAVCREEKNIHYRKYTNFYGVGVYGGIATAYSVGCNIRCVFCWVDWSRDWPERYGKFYSPREVYNKLRQVMADMAFRRARISGAEPTLCPEHLYGVLDNVMSNSDDFDLFVIETNGFVIANEPDVADRLGLYAPRHDRDSPCHIRMSIRGGLPEPFEAKTGCRSEFVDLPFKAAQLLWNAGASFHIAVVVDERFTSKQEKDIIYDKLRAIHPTITQGIEEETLDPYPHALVRLRAVGRTDVTGTDIPRRERMVRDNMPSD